MRPLRRTVLLAGVLAPVFSGRAFAADDLMRIVDDLRQGGFVIYFRHGETGRSGADPNPVMGDCSTQRNLNDVGRAQVRRLGEDLRALRIPVGKVLSSEFCRCWQHAEAMFGKGGYTVTDKLSLPKSFPAVTDADRRKSNDHLRALLSEKPAGGTNTVLVSHGNNVLMLTGVHPNTQGEAMIFRPGDLTRIRSVLPEWTRERR
jgi:phosphohistidine phosphatase SixA